MDGRQLPGDSPIGHSVLIFVIIEAIGQATVETKRMRLLILNNNEHTPIRSFRSRLDNLVVVAKLYFRWICDYELVVLFLNPVLFSNLTEFINRRNYISDPPAGFAFVPAGPRA